MSKAEIGDKVAVMRSHDDVKSLFMQLSGTLEAVGRGLKTEDKRANAEEGEVTDDTLVDAAGWSIVKTEDGKRFSVPSKNVKLFAQKCVKQHEETMHAVARLMAEREAAGAVTKAALVRCAELGLDVENLSEKNALRIVELVK